MYDVDRLLDVAENLPPEAWSAPSRYADTGVHHGYSRALLNGALRELLAFVLDDFAPLHQASLTRLAPGGFMAPHRDAPPWRERWQVPIAGGVWGDGTVRRPGVPHRVEQFHAHSVWNPAPTPRLTLLIDVDRLLDLPPAPFALFPIPDEYAALVAAAR